MKLITILLLLVLFASCDTTRMTYVHNYSNKNVLAFVEIDSHYTYKGHMYPHIDSIPFWKANDTAKNFTVSKKLSKYSYSIVIPPKSRALLYPLNLGTPIKNVNISNENDSFSCCFYLDNKTIRQLKKERKIKSTTNWNLFRDQINYYINN